MRILVLVVVLASGLAQPPHGGGWVQPGGSIRHEFSNGTAGLYDPNTPWWPAPRRPR